MKKTEIVNIGIVGFGSRGLTLLERLFHYTEQTQRKVNIHIINPNRNASGFHSKNDPHYLLLNTAAGQISIFPFCEYKKDRLSFYEWIKVKGYKLNEQTMEITISKGREIEENDYLPRSLLAEYLQESYQELIEEVPSSVNLLFYEENVVDIQKGNGEEILYLSNGDAIPVQHVLLTTGHSGFLTGHSQYSDPYNTTLEQDLSGKKIGVAGQGLVAIDTVMELTVGRGGRFLRKNGEVTYIPSGREPRIYLFSKTGLPFLARPLFNNKETYKPYLFTHETIDEMRAEKNAYPLDFQKEILPLLWTEMKIRYYLTIARERNIHDYNDIVHTLHHLKSKTEIDECIKHLSAQYGVFDPEEELSVQEKKFQDVAEYETFIKETIEQDLIEARKGVQHNPKKAALELIRDLRSVMRHCVDFKGLTPSSHHYFVKEFYPIMNKAVTGPHLERAEEMLALVRSGIVHNVLGPKPKVSSGGRKYLVKTTAFTSPRKEELDNIIAGFIEPSNIEKNNSTLIQNLLKSGRIRPFYNGQFHIGGIDLERNLHPINIENLVEETISVLGPISEGIKFYNHYVPSLDQNVPAFVDSDKIVKEVISKFEFTTASV